MKKPFVICLVVSFLTTVSCQRDVENLEFYGVIKDIELDIPIEDALVYIVCWKYLNSADQSYTEEEIKETVTDENGKYYISFDKGAFIEIKITAKGYNEEYSTYYISKSRNKLNFELRHN